MMMSMWSKGNKHPLLVELQMYTSLWLSVWWLLRKMGINILQDPPIALRHITKRCFILSQKHLLNHVHFYSTYNSKKLGTMQMSLNIRVDKEIMIHLHNVLIGC